MLIFDFIEINICIINYFMYNNIYNIMSNTKLWFKKAFEAGKSVQKREHKHETIDGRAVWGSIEDKIGSLKNKNLTNESGSELKYNSSLNELYEEMDAIIEKFGMDKSEFCPISNHFFTQLKNLVKSKSNFNIQLNRVAQLGFNAGQLSVFIKKGTLCDDRKKIIADLVERHNMLELDTYVSPKTQSIINARYLDGTEFDLIREDGEDKEQEGGANPYYIKYLKYKSKYLQLKSK